MLDRRPNIWKLQAKKDTKGLIQALLYSDPDIRKRAAAALRVLGAVDAVSALREALKSERQPDVRDHLTAALEHLDASFAKTASKDRSRDELVRVLLSSDDAKTLIETSHKLGELGDQLSTEALVTVFRDQLKPDEVRLAAAYALIKLKSAPSVVTLLAGLKKQNWRVRHNSAAVLGQLRATWATDALIETLKDEHPNVRLAAAAALHRFQTKRAMQALVAYQKRRTGKTKPLPRRPEVVQRQKSSNNDSKRLPEPPIKRTQVSEAGKPDTNVAPPSERTPTQQKQAAQTQQIQRPVRELRDEKRTTQQLKPRLPIPPQLNDSSNPDDNPSPDQ